MGVQQISSEIKNNYSVCACVCVCVCVCVRAFCTTQNCKRRIRFFFQKWEEERKI